MLLVPLVVDMIACMLNVEIILSWNRSSSSSNNSTVLLCFEGMCFEKMVSKVQIVVV